MSPEQLDRIAAAIEQAQCPHREGPYGLYDYSSYGLPTPHRVRDFRDPSAAGYGRAVFASDDPVAADAEFERLTRRHIAAAAVAAVEAAQASRQAPDAGLAGARATQVIVDEAQATGPDQEEDR